MQDSNRTSKRQTMLLNDVFPQQIAKDLLAGKKVEPQQHECVSIFFSDIVGFTTISSQLDAREVSDLLDRLYTKFDQLADKHRIFKLETIGDAWVGATNLVQNQPDHAARIARFSIEAVRAAQATAIHRRKPEMGKVKIRVGFHSGPVVSSVVGTRNPRFCLFGDTMNTASRMESTSIQLRIQCSERSAKMATKQDRSLKFSYRGEVAVKGKGDMKTYWLYNGVDFTVEEEPSHSEYSEVDVDEVTSEFVDINTAQTKANSRDDSKTLSISSHSSSNEGMDASSLPV